MLEFIFDTARTVADLAFTGRLETYPDIPWIIPHGGGALPLLADRMELFRLAFPGGAAPVTPLPEQLRRLWFDMAGTPFPRHLPALEAAFGTDHLLYGSDYCWTPAAATAAQVAAIDSAPQPDGETWRGLTTRNAERLFPARGRR